MPTARFELESSVVNGKIYAIGGRRYSNPSGEPWEWLKTVEEYTPPK